MTNVDTPRLFGLVWFGWLIGFVYQLKSQSSFFVYVKFMRYG